MEITWKVEGRRPYQRLILFIDGNEYRFLSPTIFGKKLEGIEKVSTLVDLECFLKEREKKGAKRYAMYLLAKQNLSSYQLKSKLEAKKVSKEVIDDIIDKYKKNLWIDDEDWIERFIQKELDRCHGPLWIKEKLKRLGVGLPIIEQAIKNHLSEEKQREKIFSYIEKNASKDKQKLIRSLTRRGFPLPLVLSAFY